ncbi:MULTISPECIES: hypothetical protein [unclassified Streptomyces]|uniref:hypothetical protein n=1 Tax=unclassified Streptomyces TaxID=2593676 RepID=UPI001F0D2BED|nr:MULTISPECIES: hypothetical protein [unclassified Streptomyces]
MSGVVEDGGDGDGRAAVAVASSVAVRQVLQRVLWAARSVRPPVPEAVPTRPVASQWRLTRYGTRRSAGHAGCGSCAGPSGRITRTSSAAACAVSGGRRAGSAA